MQQIEKCKPRYPFLADRKLVEENSGARMTSEISDLSLTGCYVKHMPSWLLQRESLEVLRLWLPEAPEQPKESSSLKHVRFFIHRTEIRREKS
jgi:hypothetical protein